MNKTSYITKTIFHKIGEKQGCDNEREEYFENIKNKKRGVKNKKGVKGMGHIYINTLGHLDLF